MNNFTEQEQNPYPATLVNGVHFFSSTCGKNNTVGGPLICPTGVSGRRNSMLGTFTLGENGNTSRYDSLPASLNRRLSHNLQAQVSYAYSLCESDGDAVLTATMWFNPNCFSAEQFGTLGNFGREGLIGPALEDVDMALLKTTKIRENMTLQFRAEVFNIFNHTNLSLPISSVFTGSVSPTATYSYSATAGNVYTAAIPSRELQFGLKLTF